MNFYPHHIGDFNSATRHLTRVERSVYRDATELYYDTESVLTDDLVRLQKKLLCRSDEEKQALIDVLDEFFDLHDDGYFHARCDKEIAKYRANTSAKAKAGIASAKARKQKAAERQRNSTRVKQSVNEIQLTNNQEPLTNNQEPYIKEAANAFCVDDCFDEFWGKWPKRGDTKKTAFDKYKTKCKSLEAHELIMQGLAAQLPQYAARENSYIPAASTWLNQERWNNEPEPICAKRNTQTLSDDQLVAEFERRGWTSAGLSAYQMRERLGAAQ